jgi:uncharacterized protein YjdB
MERRTFIKVCSIGIAASAGSYLLGSACALPSAFAAETVDTTTWEYITRTRDWVKYQDNVSTIFRLGIYNPASGKAFNVSSPVYANYNDVTSLDMTLTSTFDSSNPTWYRSKSATSSATLASSLMTSNSDVASMLTATQLYTQGLWTGKQTTGSFAFVPKKNGTCTCLLYHPVLTTFTSETDSGCFGAKYVLDNYVLLITVTVSGMAEDADTAAWQMVTGAICLANNPVYTSANAVYTYVSLQRYDLASDSAVDLVIERNTLNTIYLEHRIVGTIDKKAAAFVLNVYGMGNHITDVREQCREIDLLPNVYVYKEEDFAPLPGYEDCIASYECKPEYAPYVPERPGCGDVINLDVGLDTVAVVDAAAVGTVTETYLYATRIHIDEEALEFDTEYVIYLQDFPGGISSGGTVGGSHADNDAAFRFRTAAAVGATGITLDKDKLTLAAASSDGTASVTLAATLTSSGSAAPDGGVTWNSSDEAVATVDASGKVTAVAVGMATITATAAYPLDGSVFASCVIEVVVPVVSVNFSVKTGASVFVGSTFSITAPVVLPADATDASLVWTSSDESVATYASGVISTLAVGTAVIRATVKNSAGVILPDGTVSSSLYAEYTVDVLAVPKGSVDSTSTAVGVGTGTGTNSASYTVSALPATGDDDALGIGGGIAAAGAGLGIAGVVLSRYLNNEDTV